MTTRNFSNFTQFYTSNSANLLLIPLAEDQLQQVNDLMTQYSQAITKLKNLKANFGMKSRVTNELQCQRKDIESELEDVRHSRFVWKNNSVSEFKYLNIGQFDTHFHFRIGNNDDLMKIHNEIFEQKSKVERAGRELKCARKSMVQKIGDRGYVRTFEVNV